jgi:hypothetical protein
MFRPTISGMIMDDRDHVRMTCLVPDCCAASTFFISLGCTQGPFLTDLLIG